MMQLNIQMHLARCMKDDIKIAHEFLNLTFYEHIIAYRFTKLRFDIRYTTRIQFAISFHHSMEFISICN